MRILSTILLLVLVLRLIDPPLALEKYRGAGAHVIFNADRQLIIVPSLACATVSWKTENIQAVYLNDQPEVGSGERQVCGDQLPPVLTVSYRDGQTRDYELPFIFLTPGQIALVVVIALALMLPLIKPTGRLQSLAGHLEAISRWTDRYRGAVLILVCTVLMLGGLAVRAYQAFHSPFALNDDEPLYFSAVLTGARGAGLYSFTNGLPPMPIEGGYTYGLLLYVAGVKLFGPSVFSVRAVSLIASLVGLCGICYLATKWYGRGAGWIALGVTPLVFLFTITNSIRPDSLALAYSAWALILFVQAHDHKTDLRWQFGAGLVMGLGLNFHLDTLVFTGAIGVVYLSDLANNLYEKRSLSLALIWPLATFLAGYSIAALLFVLYTILPGADSYIRNASMTRLSFSGISFNNSPTSLANIWALVRSFLDPGIVAARFQSMYQELAERWSLADRLLWAGAILALSLTHRHEKDGVIRILFVGAVVGSAVIMQSAFPEYLSLLLPIFILPVVSLLTFGLVNPARFPHNNAATFSVIMLICLGALIAPANIPLLNEGWNSVLHPEPPQPMPSEVARVQAIASPECILAGPVNYFMPYFGHWPKYAGTDDLDVMLGNKYYGLSNDLATFWGRVDPDLIFGGLPNGLERYVAEAHYKEVSPNIWVKPDNLSDGCVLTLPD